MDSPVTSMGRELGRQPVPWAVRDMEKAERPGQVYSSPAPVNSGLLVDTDSCIEYNKRQK